MTAWQALFVPTKTPPEDRPQDERRYQRALSPTRRSRTSWHQVAIWLAALRPMSLDKLLKSEIVKWSAVIKSVGIKID